MYICEDKYAHPPLFGDARMGSLKYMWGTPRPLCKVCNNLNIMLLLFAHCTVLFSSLVLVLLPC